MPKAEAGFQLPGPRYPESPGCKAHAGPSWGPGTQACGFRSRPVSRPLSVGVRNPLPCHTDVLCLALLSWPVCAGVYFSHEFPELPGLAGGTGTLGDCLPCLLASCGCCNKSPQTRGLKQQECILSLEAKSLISRCQPAHSASEVRGTQSAPSPSPSCRWLLQSLACLGLGTRHSQLCLHHYVVISLCDFWSLYPNFPFS